MNSSNRRALSIAAGSVSAYVTSWITNNTSRSTPRIDSLQNFECCRCDGIASAGIGSNASPILPIRMIRPNPNLEIAFDCRTRIPIYVMEKLTKTTLPERGSGGRRRRPNFHEEKSIDAEFRSKLSQYHKSGFDRGHMAPGADFPGDLTQDTYTLANICPQDPVMNRGIWNSLEEWIRRLVHSNDVDANSAVYVVTGPLWLPRRQVMDGKFEYQYLGLGRPPSLVAVPTHFFKVVVVVNELDAKNPIHQFACFVIGNEEFCPSKKLEDFVVPWRDLETVTGLQFFNNWVTTEWKENADKATKLQVPASIGSNASRLYLTDRTAMTSGSQLKQICPEHLCANQKCR